MTAQAAEEPFFSPDGQWVGFYAASERKLKKIPITGGASVTICDADPLDGASWAANDRILFGQLSKGILQVSANGGKPDTLFTPQSGEIVHGPQLLPGGDEVLFTLSRGRSYMAWDGAQVAARSLTTGHLVYTVGSTVFAIPFDARTRQVTGGAMPVVEGVTRAPTGTTAAAQFSASETGAMAYVAGVSTNEERTLAPVDRAGLRTPLKTR